MNEEIKRTCTACGSDRLSEGSLTDYSDWLRSKVTFRKTGQPIFSSGEPVAAYRCDQCGYLQLFAGNPRKRTP
jgi:predicted RNA-binding Zn-ribbon protein involved in translation (DUF1610 family)